MKKEVIGLCPVCAGRMKVRELSCSACQIDIRGEFELSPFNYLSKEEMKFVETFLRCQGNLKDVQAELGISYPTAKKALDGVVRSLGYDARPDETVPATSEAELSEADREAVMARVKNGEITVDEALGALRQGRKRS